MFGLPDPMISLAYLFTIGGTLLCIIYGIANWNKSDKEDDKR